MLGNGVQIADDLCGKKFNNYIMCNSFIKYTISVTLRTEVQEEEKEDLY